MTADKVALAALIVIGALFLFMIFYALAQMAGLIGACIWIPLLLC